ncbi:MAG TPA: SgcJ/EcaC family oxidoreductase [Candidatus Acidoferrales bacterium]|nr:SgcJ/EcaC family oxidoreductase [Candidatus Acidoferrales bacterium]
MQMKVTLLALSLLLFPALVRAQSGTAADEKAIREIEARWEAAWNRHDVAAMASDFAPDADVINLAGEWFKGREPFRKSLEELHSGKVKGSVWKTEDTQIKFLTPGIAIVHVSITSHGDLNPDGTPMPARHAILSRVEVKRGGKWLIVASHATNIVPRATAVVSGAAREIVGQ